MSDGFDPKRFIGMARKVGHGRALGLDYRDAAPVSGRRVGFGDARMTVEASIVQLDP